MDRLWDEAVTGDGARRPIVRAAEDLPPEALALYRANTRRIACDLRPD
jgi:hypothetical protein